MWHLPTGELLRELKGHQASIQCLELLPNGILSASDDAAIMQAGQYFDPVNFASKIKAKSVVAFGLIDTTSPPAGVFTAFDQIPAPKEAIPMVELDHNHITPQKQDAYLKRQQEVLATILKNGTFTPNANWAK